MGIFFRLFLSLILAVGQCQVKGGSSFAKHGHGEGFPAYQLVFEEKRFPVEPFFPIGGPVPDGSSPNLPFVNQYYGYLPQGPRLEQNPLEHQGTPPRRGPSYPPQAPSVPQTGNYVLKGPKRPWQNSNANMQPIPAVQKYLAYPTTMQQLHVFQQPGAPTLQFGYPPQQPRPGSPAQQQFSYPPQQPRPGSPVQQQFGYPPQQAQPGAPKQLFVYPPQQPQPGAPKQPLVYPPQQPQPGAPKQPLVYPPQQPQPGAPKQPLVYPPQQPQPGAPKQPLVYPPQQPQPGAPKQPLVYPPQQPQPGAPKIYSGSSSKWPMNPKQKLVLGRKHADLIKRPQKPAIVFSKTSQS